MAVDDSLFGATESLVLPAKKFYPAPINIGHWQLRNYISSSEPDLIYYVAKHDVYSFNTRTHVRTHICPLRWVARCFASAYGYIVVAGGECGNFAVIRLDGSPSFDAEDDADADADVDLRNRAPRRTKPHIKHLQLGSEIVSSITIHKLDNPEEPEVEDDVVAVLTNNDHSCRIYSLTQDQQAALLIHPFPVNHATISPDGQMLVVVGDYQQAFFYERVNYRPSEVKASTKKFASNLCQWEELTLVPLHPMKTNPPAVAGYFATAWSPSGHLCAVASEWGYITVFDVDRLKNATYNEEGEEAVVAVIPSTKPDPTVGPGAVRAMLFSPSPWDLLIWAEDQGRVCVADLRSSLRVRQVLELDPDEPGLEKVEMAATISLLNADVPDIDQMRDAEYNRRDRRSYDSLGNYGANLLLSEFASNSEIILERQRELLRRQREQMSRTHARVSSVLAGEDDSYQSLGSQERQILESLRSRVALDNSRSSTPRSIHYGPSELSGERRTASSSSSSFVNDFPALTRSAAATPSDTQQAWRAGPRTNEVVREYLRERNIDTDQERERDRLQFSSPRRMMSIALAQGPEPPDSVATQTTTATTSRHPPLPPHLRSQTSSPNSFPPERSDGMRPGRASSPPPPASELSPEMRRRRQLARVQERVLSLRERQLSRYETNILMSRRTMGGQQDPAFGPRTAGLAMSEDGRTLWAAADCGIWEFEVDLFSRRCFAAIELR